MHIHCCAMCIIHLPGDGIVVYTQNAYIMANGRDLSLMPDNGSTMRGQFHIQGKSEVQGKCEAQGTSEAQRNSASFCMQGYKVV